MEKRKTLFKGVIISAAWIKMRLTLSKERENTGALKNQLHWYLDVVFNEDRQRVREGNGAQNMAALRKLALQTLLRFKGKKSVKTIRKKIAWNEKLLIDVLAAF